MPNRPLMFVAAPVIAAPIVVAFLFVGGPSEPPAESSIDATTSSLEQRTPHCGSPVDRCPQGFAMRTRPLEC
jgi:hypothetical protein